MKTKVLLFILGAVLTLPQGWGRATETVNDETKSIENQPAGDYVLSIGDVIQVQIYLQSDLSTAVTIDSIGHIRLPLVDTVEISGFTIADAQTIIEQSYRDNEFLRSPHVTIRVLQHVMREVMITGQVKVPGSYRMPNDREMNILDLIVQAGGMTAVARGNSVSISRTNSSNQKTSTTVEVANLLRGDGDEQAPDLILKPGDIIFVPERIF